MSTGAEEVVRNISVAWCNGVERLERSDVKAFSSADNYDRDISGSLNNIPFCYKASRVQGGERCALKKESSSKWRERANTFGSNISEGPTTINQAFCMCFEP